MIQSGSKYSGRDIAVVVPTKDRPKKIQTFLESITSQTVQCRRIIVVDGGESVKDIVLSFTHQLPVEYYTCSPPGQIRQRNLALSLINETTPLVAFFDDDILLLPDAFERMILFWNSHEHETAGVSFNIINLQPEKHTWLKGMLGLTGPVPGRVLRSGRNTPILSVKENLRTQWLCGGATVWRQDILGEFLNQERTTKWAMAEDLLFSYPIGKRYPLYVCADARARHEHVFDHNIRMKYKYYGRTETLWFFNFVESHKELSRTYFIWMQLTTIMARLIMGIATVQSRHIQFALGQIEGLAAGMLTLIRGRELAMLLEDNISIDRR